MMSQRAGEAGRDILHIEAGRTSRTRTWSQLTASRAGEAMSPGLRLVSPAERSPQDMARIAHEARIDTPAVPAYLSTVAVRSFSHHSIVFPRFPCSAP